jgi:putative endonuclease
MQGASIYILQCSDGSYYTGVTRRAVEERASEHAQGLVEGCYTASRLPVTLVFSEYYERIDEAVAAERRIKGWSRAKKEAYMRGDFERLSTLARRKGTRAAKNESSSFETGAARPPQDEGARFRALSTVQHKPSCSCSSARAEALMLRISRSDRLEARGRQCRARTPWACLRGEIHSSHGGKRARLDFAHPSRRALQALLRMRGA